ncbi:MAG: hypothetical protein KAX49_20480 [Halanaerobiales bacterium]|nr:hypothetical protein [Halanaerobiales bacterium]
MKKSILMIVILIFLVVSCNSQPQLVKDINSEVEEVNKFISISVIEFRNGSQIRLSARNEGRFLGICSFIGKKDISDIDYSVISDSLITLNYQIFNFDENVAIEKHYMKENDILVAKKEEFNVTYSELSKVLAWGEGSMNGINTHLDKLQLVSTDTVKKNGVTWDCITGEYDFNERYPSIAEQQGTFKLWFDFRNNTAIEVYRGKKGTRLIVRQVWLNEDPEVSFDIDEDIETLIRYFLKYYKKTNFNNFLHE